METRARCAELRGLLRVGQVKGQVEAVLYEHAVDRGRGQRVEAERVGYGAVQLEERHALAGEFRQQLEESAGGQPEVELEEAYLHVVRGTTFGEGDAGGPPGEGRFGAAVREPDPGHPRIQRLRQQGGGAGAEREGGKRIAGGDPARDQMTG